MTDVTIEDDGFDGEIDARPPPNVVVASVRHLSSTLFSSHNSSRNSLSVTGDGSVNDGQDAGNVLVDATLVEVAEAESIGFCYKHGKTVASLSLVLLVALGVSVSLTYQQWAINATPTSMPSTMPSWAPSFDPRPTLEVVQERRSLRCGHFSNQNDGSFRFQLCQAIAAVTLNDPSQAEKIDVTAKTRFIMLKERSVDLLAGGDTYTVEREVNEATTNSSFTFSTPYYYDGMIFAGNQTYLTCAEEQKRYNECSQLVICVGRGTTDYDYVTSHFTSEFTLATSGTKESILFYSLGACNVVADSRLALIDFKYREGDTTVNDPTFVIGNRTFNNDPLAFVTRSDDPEWSNIVNWCLQALFYGERQGVTKNATLCQLNTNNLSGKWSELNFLNAVYCVGNYAEIYDQSQFAEYTRTPINTINNGTPMLYVIPFGDLHHTNNQMFYDLSPTFTEIKNRNMINCGLFMDDCHENNTIKSTGLCGMGVDYCQTLASSMLDGNFYGVNFTIFSNTESSIIALDNEEIDVLFGVTADMSLNFGTSLAGVVFSTPIYYGNQTNEADVEFYPIITRQNDESFSSFVNCIVLSTLYAVNEDINSNNSFVMPSMTIFGSDMLWSLKDAISANGNYYDIYFRNFAPDKSRGRNDLNFDQGPQLLDMPGL